MTESHIYIYIHGADLGAHPSKKVTESHIYIYIYICGADPGAHPPKAQENGRKASDKTGKKTAPPEKVRRTCGAHAQIAKKCAGCPLTAPIMI